MSSDNSDQTDIAILTPDLAGGGAERVAVTMANEFSARGHKVDLVCGTPIGPQLKRVVKPVRIIDLHTRRFRYSLVPLVRYLRRSQPSSMLCFQTQSNLIGAAARYLSGRPKRLVLSERHSISGAVANPEAPWLRRAPILMKILYRAADAVIAVSEGAAADLVATIGIESDLVSVVYNPVDISQIQRMARQPAEHPWLRDKNIPVILGVGRLSQPKDFATLIRAVEEVSATRRVRLVILGEGRERQSLETLVGELGLSEYVDLPGFVDNPYASMARADVFALTSRVEGFPNVLVEAMSLGCSVVATNCPSGPAEILDSGRFGRLAEPGNPRDIAQKILEVLDRPVNAQAVRRRAMDWALDPIVDQYLSVVVPHE